jgi:hypothetical protein
MSVFNGNLFIKKYAEYKNENIDNINKNDSILVMNMHTGFEQFDCTPLEVFEQVLFSGKGFDFIFENTLEKRYQLTCTEDQLFYNFHKGFIQAKDVDTTSILVDVEGRLCKLIKKSEINVNGEVTNIKTKWNDNYFFNNILCG